MSSTSIRNTQGNYQLEQQAFQRQFDFITYKHSSTGQAVTRNVAGDGLLPAKMNSIDLADNYVDIESQLLGIGSTNLVKPLEPVIPKINTLNSLNIIDKVPIVIPDPMFYIHNQRPNYRN